MKREKNEQVMKRAFRLLYLGSMKYVNKTFIHSKRFVRFFVCIFMFNNSSIGSHYLALSLYTMHVRAVSWTVFFLLHLHNRIQVRWNHASLDTFELALENALRLFETVSVCICSIVQISIRALFIYASKCLWLNLYHFLLLRGIELFLLCDMVKNDFKVALFASSRCIISNFWNFFCLQEEYELQKHW